MTCIGLTYENITQPISFTYLAFLTFSLVAGWLHIQVFMLGQTSIGRSPRCHARHTHDTRLSQAP